MQNARMAPRLPLALAFVVGVMNLGAVAEVKPENMQLFLLIGQSNMAGRGHVGPDDRIPHPRVFMLTKELAWVPAVDPIHFDKPERIGAGLAKTFGTVVAEAAPSAVIGLIPAAFGGSALDEWAPGQPHYTNAITRAKEAMKRGRLAGILWHQGESDSAPARTATYADRFARMIAQLRADLGAENVPVIVGETGRFRPDGAAINAVLATLPAHVPQCAFVPAEGLGDLGDQLHFDTAALHEFGRRYAKAWMELKSR